MKPVVALFFGGGVLALGLGIAWSNLSSGSSCGEGCALEAEYSAEELAYAEERLARSRRSADPVAVPDLGPAHFCFAEGTPPSIVAAFMEAMRTAPDGAWPNGRRHYDLGPLWGNTNTARTITWSLVPDGLSVDGSSSQLFSRMDTLFASQGGRAKWIGLIEQCFQRWGDLTGVSYVRRRFNNQDWDDGATFGLGGNANRGDVRIAMIPIDGVNSVLAYNYYPNNGDMVIDSAENWGTSTNNFRFFRNTVMHEHGHGLGIAHVCSNNTAQLMEPFLSTSFDGPQHDDLRAGQRGYGDAYEPNGTTATAHDLGALPFPATVNPSTVPTPVFTNSALTAISVDGDQDHFKFSTPQTLRITTTVTPLGLTYDDNDQAQNGSCPSGSSTDSLRQADLALDILGNDGNAIASAAATGLGQSESITDRIIQPGTYFARVRETGTVLQTQVYRLEITTVKSNTPPTISFTGGTAVTAGDSINLDFNATDVDSGDTITFSIVNGPQGGGINASTGVYTAPTTPSQGGQTLAVTVRATDNGDPQGSAETTVNVTVNVRPQVLSGSIDRPSWVGSNPIPANYEIRSGATVLIQGTLQIQANGSFSVPLPSPLNLGTRQVSIDAPAFLRRTSGNVNSVLGGITGLNLDLIAGDSNGDNVVDLDDYFDLADAFRTNEGDAGFNPDVDFDGSGSIDLDDYFLLAEAFRVAGDD